MEWTVEQVDQMRIGRPTFGDRKTSGALTWLRTSKETGGEYTLIYGEASPGYLVPEHYHTLYTESIKILEGSFEGRADNRSVNLRPGEEISIPPRMVHAWGPVSEPSRMLLEIRPAHEGFEKWIILVHAIAAAREISPAEQRPNFIHEALFLTESDTHLTGRARLLNPVLKVVAWCARKAGVTRRLEEKYLHSSSGDMTTS